MLKSTHKPSGSLRPLPTGWTEHKAPTGHSYYYNAATQESTYTRPSVVQESQTPLSVDSGSPGGHEGTFNGAFNGAIKGFAGNGSMSAFQAGYPNLSSVNTYSRPGTFTDYQHGQRGRGDFRGGCIGHHQRRPPVQDKPKSKQTIPGCAPWLLVKTKLGRRFVYNPEIGESFWKFPLDVMKGVVELDRTARERKERMERGEDSEAENETAIAAELSAAAAATREASTQSTPVVHGERAIAAGIDSDEFEEVEVTDDEDGDNPSKRQKIEGEPDEQPVEFDEDDIAYQLAAMGQEYGLDPGEYGDDQNEEWEEGAEGLPLTEEDANALFKDMLDDHQISPYTTWDKLTEDGQIIEDDRYTVLSSMKARRDVWGEWSKERIQRLREQREKEEKKDPRIPYLSFLQTNATPKLYWPEFRRKYKKEAEMRDTKLSDKEREKYYRDYINRLKLPESTLKSGLSTLLKALPLQILNRSTSLEALPPAILTDMRYVSLRPHARDPLIGAYISTLPPAPEQSDISPEEEAEISRQRQERERREKALAERERRVQEEKRRQKSALQHSKGMLREGEEEIERAMKVGKEGLRGYLEGGEAPKLPNSSLEAASTLA
ncbi:WW domain [Lasallia pustulata]|uniref:WW domain n=1 Tax=Lasallia pustulata TaxID=136370 RepID=A0A1W5D1D3_9LECA|nr:WW domain [Lasallia pustulata]